MSLLIYNNKLYHHKTLRNPYKLTDFPNKLNNELIYSAIELKLKIHHKRKLHTKHVTEKIVKIKLIL